jgi:hypothetical protein
MTTADAKVELVALAECPPGLFRFEGILGFKTEYGATTGKDVGGGKVEWTVTSYSDAYCVESGEVFWGGVTKHEDREKLLVEPITALEASHSSRTEVMTTRGTCSMRAAREDGA